MRAPTRENVAALQARPHAEVLIIGGGINGLATFRELVTQGVDVALVERDDFVSGASSASSHMVHGGIRYLENGEFRLVHEAVVERNLLLRNAPHVVKPLVTTIPIFRTWAGILAAPKRLLFTHRAGERHERGAVLIAIGLSIYDLFSRGRGAVPLHRFRTRGASLRAYPDLNPGLRFTATYYDASMHDPERLALDVLADGIQGGGRAANYLAAVGSRDGAVVVRDARTGEEFEIRADLVINASGPFTDLTNEALGLTTRFLGGTKGSHIVLDHPELLAATRGHELFFENSDGRIVLIYPLKGRVLVGTTDLDTDVRETPVCTDAEIDYFFGLVRHVLPGIEVNRSHIVYTFAGIRPLPSHEGLAPGFVSRDYRIERASLGATPLLSLVGGKWTTFRALGARLAAEAMDVIGADRRRDTKSNLIGGGIGFPTTAKRRAAWLQRHASGHPLALAERMLDRYGTRARHLLAEIPVDAAELSQVPGWFAQELAWLAREEQVVTLADVVLRRTPLAFLGGLTVAALREIAAVIAPVLDWDAATIDAEVTSIIELLATRHRVDVVNGGLAPEA
ncbi:glycerol-3-phosphate dehydrogenase/oxidase [Gulosibacter macacae]|uniref:Glycerol-3-phosphate dehydrogenase/oxidase n=1 Tax=Gulosibacter macacae TaxID=2488791 RepID=A0A3P3VVY5_9MICO|nr:glycerol-3-phosphate dehydrogenase/oxidase [Gulosibacter macacae]RRJ86971.1 glycerol-3-phosphate dehydrogenase/oxidase [Gulosibacter macacae]